ncbi:hypothetical protein [Nonomuraea sp. JJY05]
MATELAGDDWTEEARRVPARPAARRVDLVRGGWPRPRTDGATRYLAAA